MAIDYNRLMEELDSCLGLESSVTKSVKRPLGPSKKRKAFEGYDDVDLEIIQAMKDSPEGAPSEFSEEDLVYSEDTPEGDQGMPRVEDDEGGDEESPEIKLADSVDCLFNNYIESGKTPQEAADSIKDLVESAVAELYDPDDEEAKDPDDEEAEADEGMKGLVTPVREVSSHSLANKSAEESSSSATEAIFGYKDPRFQTLEDIVVRKLRKAPIDKEYKDGLIGDIMYGGVEDWMGYLDESGKYLRDKIEEDLKDEESMNRAADAYVKFRVDQYNKFKGSADEANSGIVDDDPYDPDAAFEALSSKMLNRYSQLTHRNQLKSKKSAEEGVSATEVKIDDNAIRRVSCEFAYSGKNLRKMVAEAIKKGVI